MGAVFATGPLLSKLILTEARVKFSHLSEPLRDPFRSENSVEHVQLLQRNETFVLAQPGAGLISARSKNFSGVKTEISK